MAKESSRYRVQFYTERNDGTKEYCVCDFRDEEETGRSPIVDDHLGRRQTWTDRAEAERVAAGMNAA